MVVFLLLFLFKSNPAFSNCAETAMLKSDEQLGQIENELKPIDPATLEKREKFLKKLDEARKFKKLSVNTLEEAAPVYEDLFMAGSFSKEDATFMKKVGFELSGDGSAGTKVTGFPLPERFAKNYREYMEELIKSGKIKKEDVLYPGRIIVPDNFNVEAGLLTFPPGKFASIEGEIPKGFKEAPLKIMGPDAFAQMLSEGYFPLGGIDQIINAGPKGVISMYEHDVIGHFVRGFMKDPEYMKAIKESYSPAAISERSKAIASGELSSFIFNIRENIVLEQLNRVKKNSDWRDIPGIPVQVKTGTKASKADLVKYYSSLSEEELAKKFQDLDKNISKIFEPVAGNNASGIEGNAVINFNKYTSSDPCGHGSNSFLSLVCRMRLSFANPKDYEGYKVASYLKYSNKGTAAAKAEVMSDLLIAAQELEKITPAEWASAALKPKLDSNSKLFKILCTGELGAMDSLYDIRMAHGCP